MLWKPAFIGAALIMVTHHRQATIKCLLRNLNDLNLDTGGGKIHLNAANCFDQSQGKIV